MNARQRRHAALAKRIAAWTSWMSPPWFTNGSMSVELLDPPRGAAMRLEFACLCDAAGRHAHRHSLDRLCVFGDAYEPDPRVADTLSKVLVKSVGDGRVARLDIDKAEPIEAGGEPGLLIYRATINGSTDPHGWVGLNASFVDLVDDEAKPDRWVLRGVRNAPPVGSVLPSSDAPPVLALRGSRLVGVVMPIACNESAIGVAPVETAS